MKMLTRLMLIAMLTVSLGAVVGCGDDESEFGAEARPIEPIMPANMVEMSFPTGDRETSVIHLMKAAPSEVTVGEDFTYNITVTNLTALTLRDVTVNEQLPEGFMFRRSMPKAQRAEQGVRWQFETLEPFESEVIGLTGIASKEAIFSGKTTVDYKMPEVNLEVAAVQPNIKLKLTGPQEALLCDPIPIEVEVRNEGSGAAKNVLIMNTLPEGLQTMKEKRRITLEAGEMKPGEIQTFKMNLQATSTGDYAQVASLTTAEGYDSESNVLTTKVRTPSLVITKSGPDERYVERPLEYTIKVTNTGDAPATNVILRDEIPARANFVRASHEGALAAGKVEWDLGTIPPGESRKVLLTLKPTEVGELTSTATATAHCTRDTEEIVTQIRGIPTVFVEVSDTGDPVRVGNTVAYEIKVTNQDIERMRYVVIECEFPNSMEYVSSSGPTEEIVSGSTIRFEALPSLPSKQTETYHVVLRAVRDVGDVSFRVRLTSANIRKPVEAAEGTSIEEQGADVEE